MRQPRLFQGLLCLCLIGSSQAGATDIQFFDAIEEPVGTLSTEEHRYLSFGEVVYDYYRNDPFNALNTLLINQQQGLFNDDTEYAELLLGDLYVSYGLPQQAETIFTRLLKRELVTRTRAQTWLHKAALHYREGEPEALDILDSNKVDGLDQTDEARRRLMLANLLMQEEDFTAALDHLHGIPLDTDEGRYATYNMGVALIRAGQQKAGIQLLDGLVRADAQSDQALALRDRAALAIGLTSLRDNQLNQARSALQRVRVDGPFSEDALLALGLVNYRRGEISRALPLWLETVSRNSSHPSVQEALLLAPQAYEELGGQTQALAGYQYAAQQYREELKKIQLAMDSIGEDGWAKALLPNSFRQPELLFTASTALAESGELPYLYTLFASNRFAQRFEHYRQLAQIKAMLEYWQSSLPALVESHQTQQQQLRQALPRVRAALTGLLDRQEQLQQHTVQLPAKIPQRLDINQAKDLANAEQAIMWQKVEALTAQFDRLPGNNQSRQIRLQRVRGVLLSDIAAQAEQQHLQQQQDAARLNQESDVLVQRVAAIRQQTRDSSLRSSDDLGQRLTAQKQRISSLLERCKDALQSLERAMQHDALSNLQQQQQRLADQLAEAHLAMARLQDSATHRTGGRKP